MIDKETESLIKLSNVHIQLENMDQLSSKEDFINSLDKYFDYLLRVDFEKLLQIMYRIDVPEQDFKLTLQADSPKVSKALAELVYKRLLIKVQLREKYK